MNIITIKGLSLAATTIHLSEPTAALGQSLIRIAQETGWVEEASEIYYDGEFVGFPGDIIELKEGDFSLVANIGVNYSIEIAGEVGLHSLKIDEARFYTDTCAFVDILESQDPVRTEITYGKHIIDVRIGLTNIVDTGDDGGCYFSMLAPIQRAAIVNFISTPPGAEIWVNGMALDHATDVALSVPFTKYDEDEPYRPLSVVVRLGGYVNQVHEVDIRSRSVKANLETAEQWAARVLE